MYKCKKTAFRLIHSSNIACGSAQHSVSPHTFVKNALCKPSAARSLCLGHVHLSDGSPDPLLATCTCRVGENPEYVSVCMWCLCVCACGVYVCVVCVVCLCSVCVFVFRVCVCVCILFPNGPRVRPAPSCPADPSCAADPSCPMVRVRALQRVGGIGRRPLNMIR